MTSKAYFYILTSGIVALSLMACQDDKPDDAAAQEDMDVMDSGTDQADLNPLGTLEVKSIAVFTQVKINAGNRTRTLDASTDEIFFIFEVFFSNASMNAISVNSGTLTARTDVNLDYNAHPESNLIEGSCPANASLSPQGTITCKVFFALPSNTTPTTLIHTRPEGSVTADIDPSLLPDMSGLCQSMCGGSCKDLNTDNLNCGECNRRCDTSTGFGQTCVQGACRNLCLERCEEFLKPENCGLDEQLRSCVDICIRPDDFPAATACISDPMTDTCTKLASCLTF